MALRVNPYPAFTGTRRSVKRAQETGSGKVAGRWLPPYLVDESGQVRVECFYGQNVRPGDWVAGILKRLKSFWVMEDSRVYSRNLLSGHVPDRPLYERRKTLEARRTVLRRVRQFFDKRGFLEVETPYRVVCPAVEPFLEGVPSGTGYLITSPELHMKRLLTAGFERIYQVARVFRGEESGARHIPEFTLLEWYRTWSTLDALMVDSERLVSATCRSVGRAEPKSPFPRISYRDLFTRATGIDPFTLADSEKEVRLFREFAKDQGLDFADSSNLEDLIEGIFAQVVEPTLQTLGAVFVTEYPPWAAVLSRVSKRNDALCAERFELYLDGIELANAYHEVTDPEVNRRQLQASARRRVVERRVAYPPDHAFLTSLEGGLPPSVGIALGVDRLMMWLLGRNDIRSVCTFY